MRREGKRRVLEGGHREGFRDEWLALCLCMGTGRQGKEANIEAKGQETIVGEINGGGGGGGGGWSCRLMMMIFGRDGQGRAAPSCGF